MCAALVAASPIGPSVPPSHDQHVKSHGPELVIVDQKAARTDRLHRFCMDAPSLSFFTKKVRAPFPRVFPHKETGEEIGQECEVVLRISTYGKVQDMVVRCWVGAKGLVLQAPHIEIRKK
jgi:hypothetical protein